MVAGPAERSLVVHGLQVGRGTPAHGIHTSGNLTLGNLTIVPAQGTHTSGNLTIVITYEHIYESVRQEAVRVRVRVGVRVRVRVKVRVRVRVRPSCPRRYRHWLPGLALQAIAFLLSHMRDAVHLLK